jgi:flavin reductase (DIM6/NTAB) family NADH-FMN oxidoreductase RutF
MADSPSAQNRALAQALGRVPSGLFILTTRWSDGDSGMLVSWVQQAAFEPPMVTVALRHNRPAMHRLSRGGHFVLNQIAAGQKALLRHFARGFDPGEPAFEGLRLSAQSAAAPVLADALAFLEAEIDGHVDAGDHRIILARVTDGALLQEGEEPMIHVRHNGFHY